MRLILFVEGLIVSFLRDKLNSIVLETKIGSKALERQLRNDDEIEVVQIPDERRKQAMLSKEELADLAHIVSRVPLVSPLTCTKKALEQRRGYRRSFICNAPPCPVIPPY